MRVGNLRQSLRTLLSTRCFDDLRVVLGPDRARAEPLELALYGRDAGVDRGSAGVVCFPTTTERARGCRARHRRSRPPVRRAGERHRPRRRGHAARRRGRDRHHADEPRPRGRPDGARRVGGAGRLEPRSLARRRPPRAALRPRPVVAAGVHDRRQRGHQRGRAALPRVRRDVHARARGRRRARRRLGRPARRPRARPARLRPPRLLRRQRGNDGHRRAHRRAAHAQPAGDPHAAARLHRARRRGRDGERDHRGRHRARGARDDGRRDHRVRSRTTSVRATRATPRPCCSWRSTAWKAASQAQVDAIRDVALRQRRAVRCASRPTRPNAPCSGRAGSRRSARSPASLPTTTSTTRWCRARSSSTCCARCTASPASNGSR